MAAHAMNGRRWNDSYVLDQMVDNGWATWRPGRPAKAAWPDPRQAEAWDPSVGYFVEKCATS